MAFYREKIFPRLCHLALSDERMDRYRRETLASAAGEVLEIGLGTGLNLPHYPEAVEKVVAVEPNRGMHHLAAPQLAKASVPAEILAHGAEDLPFPDARFDCAVSTWTLCSIPQVGEALAEIHRVLKPGGAFLFMEHGLSPRLGVARWQRRLTPIQRRVADGCHLDRDMEALLMASGFDLAEHERFYLPRTPAPFGYVYRGRAVANGR